MQRTQSPSDRRSPAEPFRPSTCKGSALGAGAPGGGSMPTMPSAQAAARCRLAREIASAVLGVAVEEIARPNRSVTRTCRARHLAIYLAHVVFQVPLGTIALQFGRDRTSVAHAVRRIEDDRDEEDFEQLVTRLERLANVFLDVSDAGGSA